MRIFRITLEYTDGTMKGTVGGQMEIDAELVETVGEKILDDEFKNLKDVVKQKLSETE